MEPIELEDLMLEAEAQTEEEVFGKAPQPWQLRNDWMKPKRKRKSRSAKLEIDLWKEEG